VLLKVTLATLLSWLSFVLTPPEAPAKMSAEPSVGAVDPSQLAPTDQRPSVVLQT